MFRIRRILDDVLPLDRRELEQVQSIMRAQFPGAPESDVRDLAERLRDPMRYQYRAILLVADDLRGEVKGFALASHEPSLRFVFLDYLASGRSLTGGGVGGALYEALREVARSLDAKGLFFECAPDVPEEGLSEEQLRANAARLRFYERFGARPLEGTGYRTPVKPTDRALPFLMFDSLDGGTPPTAKLVRSAVRATLERKYAGWCPPEYVELVVRSVRQDPVPLRAPRYVKAPAPSAAHPGRSAETSIALVVNDRHDIHHVRERGYVEAPIRIPAILGELERTGLFRRIEARRFSDRWLHQVHDRALIEYLRRACASVPEGKSVYPYVFPIRNASRPPKDLSVRAGYFCIDTFTPIHRNVWPAARGAVDCALTAGDEILRGGRLAYALVRPPGHHAERRVFGGFCYFNSAAVAAQRFSETGRVAILDIDYHHGNGQQDIFYERGDVLTVSIHGHPSFAYPYFSGFDDEVGAGGGIGANLNLPQPEKLDGRGYRKALQRALERIEQFDPVYLIVALGLDPASGDPTGSWSLQAEDFEANGRMIAALRRPTLVVQEGGYKTRTLGVNARRFLVGLWEETWRSSGERSRSERRGESARSDSGTPQRSSTRRSESSESSESEEPSHSTRNSEPLRD